MKRHVRYIVIPLICSLLVIGISGCRDRGTLDVSVLEQTETEQESLHQSLDNLKRLDNDRTGRIRDELIYDLNHWLDGEIHEDSWIYPTLVNQLPAHLTKYDDVVDPDPNRFFPADVLYLRECQWLSGISQWVVKYSDQAHNDLWASLIPTELSKDDRAQLRIAMSLFDWTIRNLQLIDLPRYPSSGPDGEGAIQVTASSEGLAGPGYTKRPTQILDNMTADSWQRARIFMLLARQQQLETLMIGPAAQDRKNRMPWVTGVVIGDQIWLVSCDDGMPLLDPNSGVWLRLSDLQSNADLAHTLLSDDGFEVAAETANEFIAFLEGSPMALSQRMAMLQRHLTGDFRLTLYANVLLLARKLTQEFDLQRAVLWTTAYEAEEYSLAIMQKARERDPIAELILKEEGELYRNVPAIRVARNLYYSGEFIDFDDEDGIHQDGARTFMMIARISDGDLEKLESEKEVQQKLGLVRGENENKLAFTKRVREQKQYLIKAKRLASFWLSMLHMEEGNYQQAIEWFETRLMPEGDSHPLHHIAKYNLARCYVAIGETRKATEILNNSESVQADGDKALAELLSN